MSEKRFYELLLRTDQEQGPSVFIEEDLLSIDRSYRSMMGGGRRCWFWRP